MPNTTAQDEASGAPAQTGDILAIVREVSPGVYQDFRLSLSDLATLIGGGSSPGVTAFTASRDLALADALNTINATAGGTLTIQPDSTINHAAGTIVAVAVRGAAVTLQAGTGVSLNGVTAGGVTTAAAGGGTVPQFSVRKVAADTWVTDLSGVA